MKDEHHSNRRGRDSPRPTTPVPIGEDVKHRETTNTSPIGEEATRRDSRRQIQSAMTRLAVNGEDDSNRRGQDSPENRTMPIGEETIHSERRRRFQSARERFAVKDKDGSIG